MLAHVEVETLDGTLPVRIMATRALVVGARRKLSDRTAVVFEGGWHDWTTSDAPAVFGFIVQFASPGDADAVGRWLRGELQDRVSAVRVNGEHVPLETDALIGALRHGVPGPRERERQGQ